jgi:hypothetical protein
MRIQAFEFNCLGWREYMPREMWLTYFAKASNSNQGSATLQYMPPTQFGEYGLPAQAIRALEVSPNAPAPTTHANQLYTRSVPSQAGTPDVENRMTGAGRALELQQYQAQLQLQLQLLMQLAAANRESLSVDEQRQILLRIDTVTQQIHQVQSQQAQIVQEQGNLPSFSPSPHVSNGTTLTNIGSPTSAASPSSAHSLMKSIAATAPQRAHSIAEKPAPKKRNPPSTKKPKKKRAADSDYESDDFHPGSSHSIISSTSATSSKKKQTARRNSKPTIDVSSSTIATPNMTESPAPSMVSALASQMNMNPWLNSPMTDQRGLPTSPFMTTQSPPIMQSVSSPQLMQQQLQYQQQQLHALQQLTPQQLQELQNRQFQLAQLVQLNEAQKEAEAASEQTLDGNVMIARNQHLLAQMQHAAAILGTQHKNHIVVDSPPVRPDTQPQPVNRTMSSSSTKSEDVDFAAFLEERPTEAPTW